jgi:hypothetical protein
MAVVLQAGRSQHKQDPTTIQLRLSMVTRRRSSAQQLLLPLLLSAVVVLAAAQSEIKQIKPWSQCGGTRGNCPQGECRNGTWASGSCSQGSVCFYITDSFWYCAFKGSSATAFSAASAGGMTGKPAAAPLRPPPPPPSRPAPPSADAIARAAAMRTAGLTSPPAAKGAATAAATAKVPPPAAKVPPPAYKARAPPPSPPAKATGSPAAKTGTAAGAAKMPPPAAKVAGKATPPAKVTVAAGKTPPGKITVRMPPPKAGTGAKSPSISLGGKLNLGTPLAPKAAAPPVSRAAQLLAQQYGGVARDSAGNMCANQLANGDYNVSCVLQASLLFYEAQRTGPLPASNRIPWRVGTVLNDKGPKGEDLTGGYFDAGGGCCTGRWASSEAAGPGVLVDRDCPRQQVPRRMQRECHITVSHTCE